MWIVKLFIYYYVMQKLGTPFCEDCANGGLWIYINNFLIYIKEIKRVSSSELQLVHITTQ